MAQTRSTATTWTALALALLALAALSWWLGAAPAPASIGDAPRALAGPASADRTHAASSAALSSVDPARVDASSAEASTALEPSAGVGVVGNVISSPANSGNATIPPAWLPRDASSTLARIQRGGPYPFVKDGAVFANRERRLPSRPHGSYHEYTVSAPGSRDRGARRIVCEGAPPRACWYSRDHYRSFRRIPDALLVAP